MLSFILSFFLFQTAYAAAPCGGAQVGFWTNPDGSRGGSVASTAKVQAGATIAPGAQVCEYAQVKKGASILESASIAGRAVISAGAVISGRAKVMGDAHVGGSPATPTKIGGDVVIEGSPQITGSSNIFARAKISGGSKVHNAIICQASQISGFDVVDSDYYCQTEDPEPPHPGELGKKTLLGVDSDRDGVRDDVEIWINDKFSNTSQEEKKFERLAFKEKSRFYQLIIKDRAVRDSVRSKYIQLIGVQECISLIFVNDFRGSTKVFKLRAQKRADRKELFEKTLNTRERILAWEEVLKQLSGLKLESNFKERSQCEKYLNSLL